jgi:hypothetical protein
MQTVNLGSGESLVIRVIARVAGTAAILCGLVLLFAIVTMVARGFQPGGTGGFISGIENNWLVLLCKLHFRIQGVSTNMLRSQNPIDYVIMALTCVTCVGLYLTLKETSRVWSIVALALPFLGVLIFLITHLAGRSALMAAVLAFSIIMIWNSGCGLAAACLGVAAGALLLVGDFTERLHSKVVGTIFAVGYVILVGWFEVVGAKLVAPN